MPRAAADRRPRSRWPWIAAGVLLAVALAIEFAALLGIERLAVVGGVIAPRNTETVLLLAAGAVLAALTLGLLRIRPVLLPFALAATIAALAGLPAFIGRGFANDPVPRAAAGQIRILSWNINGGLVLPPVVADLAAKEHADVVVLPEITASLTGAEYVPAFAAAGLHMHPYPAITDHDVETVVFVADGLGRYSPVVQHSAEPDMSAALVPLDATLPALVTLHAAKPTPANAAAWNADLGWVEQRCRDANTIAVGDFNSTVDSIGSSGLATCTDAATTRHAGSVGTWPTRLPTWLGMPIDHVLAGSDWSVDSFTVITALDGLSARHRPIFAVLTRRAGTG